jgi:hypothetical protein
MGHRSYRPRTRERRVCVAHDGNGRRPPGVWNGLSGRIDKPAARNLCLRHARTSGRRADGWMAAAGEATDGRLSPRVYGGLRLCRIRRKAEGNYRTRHACRHCCVSCGHHAHSAARSAINTCRDDDRGRSHCLRAAALKSAQSDNSCVRSNYLPTSTD